jgi:outer membrane protein OmpA-like peptidoglycan-associated protein/cell division protein FtsB
MTPSDKDQLDNSAKSSKSNLPETEAIQHLLELLINSEKLEENKSQDLLKKESSFIKNKTNNSHKKLLEKSEKLDDSTHQKNLQQLHQTIAQLKKKLEKLEAQVCEPTDLINPILPLITELLNSKNLESKEALLQALIPIVDQAIEARSQQEDSRMSGAIAKILPNAITYEIKHAPTEIAKAIAPEMAIAIQEQIRLDPDSISRTLAPEMSAAIENQIKQNPNAMVDALYPIVGGTFSRYMIEFVQAINQQVESAFSIEGIKRKIRAKLQGVSEAELIVREAVNYQVQGVFLIHKTSGLVIRELHPSLNLQLESDMVTGLLTAIRSFINECIAQPGVPSELHSIEYDASKIILEVAGYCYLAVIVKGEPSRRYLQKLRKTLSKIVLKYGKLIAVYEGNSATIPNAIESDLETLTKTEAQEKADKPPYALLIILAAIAALFGFVTYRGHVANRIEQQTSEALDATAELSVYRIVPEKHGDKLTLTGRVPNEYLKKQAGEIALKVASDLKLDNQIVAVVAPADPVLTAGEIERVAWIFNQKPGNAIKAKSEYGSKTAIIEGIVPNLDEAEIISQAFKKIPGIEIVTNTVQIRPILETRIYFQSGSSKYAASDVSMQIRAIREFLEENPRVHLRIIGHTDYKGNIPQNQDLGIQRARIVRQALLVENINPARLNVVASAQLPPGVTPEQPLQLSRCVRFEVFIPPNSKG